MPPVKIIDDWMGIAQTSLNIIRTLTYYSLFMILQCVVIKIEAFPSTHNFSRIITARTTKEDETIRRGPTAVLIPFMLKIGKTDPQSFFRGL